MYITFLMQIYSFFERELSKYVITKYNIKSEHINLFTCIREIESKEKIKINSDVKEKLNLCRNIINVYKHGFGESYDEIKTSNPSILNIIANDKEMYFVLNLKKIKIENYIKIIEKFLVQVEQVMLKEKMILQITL